MTEIFPDVHSEQRRSAHSVTVIPHETAAVWRVLAQMSRLTGGLEILSDAHPTTRETLDPATTMPLLPPAQCLVRGPRSPDVSLASVPHPEIERDLEWTSLGGEKKIRATTTIGTPIVTAIVGATVLTSMTIGGTGATARAQVLLDLVARHPASVVRDETEMTMIVDSATAPTLP